MERTTPNRVFGNRILHVCEPHSASSYSTLLTSLHRTGNRTGSDHIPHSAGIRVGTEGNRILHCIQYRVHSVQGHIAQERTTPSEN